MNEIRNDVRKRRRIRLFKISTRFIHAFFLFIKDKIKEDFLLIGRQFRLFFGAILACIGIFSFASDRYCDGNTSTYYTCTRPATYYYYPWWAITFILLGTMLICLWFLRQKR